MKTNTTFKEFSKYTIFNVLGMLGLSCYILADTFFIAKGLGANGLTSLNLAIPVYSIIHGCGLMLGMGCATKFSIYKSQTKNDKANTAFSSTMKVALFLSLLFIALGLFFSEHITTLLGANQDVFAMTNTYIKVILLFSFAFIFNDIFVCMVRNDGEPKLSMMAMLIGSFANIILDYILIFPMNMGILGAVLATGVSPIISICILFWHRSQKKNTFHLIKTKIHTNMMRHAISLGIPSFVSELSSGIIIIVFNMLILSISGNIGVAAYGVIANLSLVSVAVFAGIAQGIQPLISKAHAALDKQKSKQILRYALLTMICISILMYGFVYFTNHTIISLFNSENNTTLNTLASVGLKLYFTSLIFMGFNIILSIYFTSINKPKPAHIISLLRGLVLVIPIAFFLSHLWGMNGVWLSVPVCEGIVAIFSIHSLKNQTH